MTGTEGIKAVALDDYGRAMGKVSISTPHMRPFSLLHSLEGTKVHLIEGSFTFCVHSKTRSEVKSHPKKLTMSLVHYLRHVLRYGLELMYYMQIE